MWVLIQDIARQKDPIGLLARAMTELAVAEGLVLIHGREHGARRYLEIGGTVRMSDLGEPMIWVEP